MGDVTIKESRYRISYTPEGGDEIMLVSVGDAVNEDPLLEGGPQVETTALLDSAWTHHIATGNAEVTLSLDVHRSASSAAAAQALGLRMWRYLTTHPQGTIRFQTAFLHSKSCPLIDWEMKASCSSVTHEEVDVDSSPFETAASCHLSFEFIISLPESDLFDI